MKGIWIGMFLFVGVGGVFAQPDLTYSDQVGTLILLGQGDRSDMENPPFNQWFDREYETYVPDQTVLAALRKPFRDIHTTIVLGTWCSDSHREVPRFFKILDELGGSDDMVTVYYVNGDKTSPDPKTKQLDIERVPTFIFTREGVELGRIIESPETSLEGDMKKIILKE